MLDVMCITHWIIMDPFPERQSEFSLEQHHQIYNFCFKSQTRSILPAQILHTGKGNNDTVYSGRHTKKM